MSFLNVFRIVGVSAWIALLPSSAHAYLDPGTGSVMLQIILGGLAGLAVAGKLFWHRILAFVGLGKTKQDDENDEHEPGETTEPEKP